MKYALIIGNDRYDDPKLAQLKTPAADSQALAKVLDDREIGSFDEVISLINQSETQARRAVSAFLGEKKPGDLVLLYFSGHVVLDDRGRLYLALRDTQLSLLKATSIPSSFIADEMDSCRSRRQVLVLDCCHSGAFARGTKGEQKAITETTFEGSGFGRVVLTASDSTQYALEGDQVIKQTELSLFTHFLLEGLRTGEADMNNDGQVSLDEWYDYTYTRVIAETPRQVPHKWSYNQQGDLVIARNPSVKKKAAALPNELVQALESSFVGIRESAVMELGKYLRSPDPDLVHLAAASLERMKDDDSRRISSLAGKLLEEFEHERHPGMGAPGPDVEMTVTPSGESEAVPQAGAPGPEAIGAPNAHTAASSSIPGTGPLAYRAPIFNGIFWLKWIGTLLLAAAGFYLLYSLSKEMDEPTRFFVMLSGVVIGLAGLAQWFLFRGWLEFWWVPMQISAGIILGFLQRYLYDHLDPWGEQHVAVLFAVWAAASLVVGPLLIRIAKPAVERASAFPEAGARRTIFFALLSIALLVSAIFSILLLLERSDLITLGIAYGIFAVAAGGSFFLDRNIPRNFGTIALAVYLIADGIMVGLWGSGTILQEAFTIAFMINAVPALAAGIFFLSQKDVWRDLGFLMLSGYLITRTAAGITSNYANELNRIFLYLFAFLAVLAAAALLIRRK